VKSVVWTDGSCNANGMHGRGGWAALIEQAGTVREISGSAHGTTHNRMELTAICEALETLTGVIEVRTDSALRREVLQPELARAVAARWLLEGIERPGQEPRPLGAVVRFGMGRKARRDLRVDQGPRGRSEQPPGRPARPSGGTLGRLIPRSRGLRHVPECAGMSPEVSQPTRESDATLDPTEARLGGPDVARCDRTEA